MVCMKPTSTLMRTRQVKKLRIEFEGFFIKHRIRTHSSRWRGGCVKHARFLTVAPGFFQTLLEFAEAAEYKDSQSALRLYDFLESKGEFAERPGYIGRCGTPGLNRGLVLLKLDRLVEAAEQF